jgi:signal transduction histidine kinase
VFVLGLLTNLVRYSKMVDDLFPYFKIKFPNSPVYHKILNYCKSLAFCRGAVCFLMALVPAINGLGQNHAIDSLRTLLDTTPSGSRVDILYQLGYEFIDVDNEQALRYSNESYEIAKRSGDSLRVVKAIVIKGSSLRRMERLDEAIEVSLEGLRIAERNTYTNEFKTLLNSIAIAHSLKAEYDKALEFHYQSLILRELAGDKSEISITLNNIGFVYFKLRNYQQAVDYFTRSLELRREAKDNYDMDRLLINLGTCYIHLRDFSKAEDLIMEGLKTCGDACTDDIRLQGFFSLGVAHYNLEHWDNAKEHFRQSFDISKRLSNVRFQAENLIYLGKIAMQLGQYQQAEDMFGQAEALAKTSGYNQLLMDSYKQFSILYNDIKDFQRAAINQNKYITLKDSFIGEGLVNNIAKIQSKFEERENIATIESKNDIIRLQGSLITAIVIIAILAGALIFVLYRSIKVKRKVNADLSDAKAIIEDQNRQLTNSNVHLNEELKEKNIELQKANDSLHRVNEELDNFIYKTSHDIRGPLASLKGMCNVALMDVKDPLALSYLNKLDITAEKLNTILTRLLIVNQINHSSLASDRIDFPGIVDEILLLEKKKGLPKRLTITKSICPKTVFHSDPQLVRIILENLIDNAIKFYNDSDRAQPFVNINIGGNGEHLSIHVVDNGIGISKVHPNKIFQMFSRASERSETGGIGLYITKTAAEKLGGTVHLKTTPEGYTEFYVKLPYATSRVFA